MFVSENNTQIRPTVINDTRHTISAVNRITESGSTTSVARYHRKRNHLSLHCRLFQEIPQFAGHVLMSHYSSNDWKRAVDNLSGLNSSIFEISEFQKLPVLYGGLIIPCLPKLAPF